MSKTKKVSDEIKLNIHNEIEKILELYKSKQIDSYDFTKLLNLDLDNYVLFLEKISKIIYMTQGHQESDKNFKLSYFIQLVTLLVNNVLTYKNNDKIFQENIKYFLYLLSIIKDGHKLLQKIKYIIIINDHNLKKDILTLSSIKGVFPVFLFWIDFFKIDIFKDEYEYIISLSIKNADDRLYKWILEKIKENKSMLLQKNYIIEQILSNLLTSISPTKYKLKKLKILSENCNLKPYFNKMLYYDIGVIFSIKKELFKYYYHNPIDINQILTIHSYHYIEAPSIEDYKYIYNKLITDQEKFYFQIVMMIYNNCNFGLEYDINKLTVNKKDLIKNYETILHMISITINYSINNDNIKINTLEKLFNYKICGIAIKILCKLDFFKYALHLNNNTLYFIKEDMLCLLCLSKFVSVKNSDGVKINLMLHYLRLMIKRKIKSKIIGNQIKIFPLMEELRNFKPSNKPILSKGSYNWQLNKQKFTNLPPRHLLPDEFNIYNSFLIREKADGILVNNLSTNIFPECEKLKYCIVKAEFIENNDLYFVFDIDIPNTSIIERYNIIRSMHPWTNKTSLETINTLEELVELLQKERIIFNDFLDKTKKHNIRWYPKVSFLVNDCSNKLKEQIIQDIIINSDSSFSKFINNQGNYTCDGLIISPIDGMREIKIKPKNIMTIDLLYDGKNWLDKENNKYTTFITSSNTPKKGNIYRCYPIGNDKYDSREIRFDKKTPNNFRIINYIKTIYKNDWVKNMTSPYYQVTNVKLDSVYIKELEKQTNIFSEQIKKLSPELNKSWLDLGCGKGKLINEIKKYSPKMYIGLDIDSTMLLENIQTMDENEHINLSPCDLRQNWFENSKWFNIKNMKFDYIVLNFSIMHLFDSEQFWKCLKEVTKSDTKILFNVVADKVKTQEFKLKNAYMRYQDGNIYYSFPWAHKTEITEQFIERKQIEEKVRNNRLLIDIITNLSDTKNECNELSSYYDWYILVSNSEK
jgi:ubiquinone/menaquinone biosynthesis C-methylase UbiE